LFSRFAIGLLTTLAAVSASGRPKFPRARMLVTAAPPISKQVSVMMVIAFDKQDSVRGGRLWSLSRKLGVN
jgi:hypothetical protein